MRQHFGRKSIQRLRRKTQRGVVLLEILISFLLFSLGLMSLIGLQAKSLTLTGEAQYRIEAIRLANDCVAKMWAYQSGSYDDFAAAFSQNGKEYVIFKDQVMGSDGIPNAKAPEIDIDAPSPTTIPLPDGKTATLRQANVTITIEWADKETNAIHNYTHVTTLGLKS